jgi:nitrogen fixation-related uncharacterized protein
MLKKKLLSFVVLATMAFSLATALPVSAQTGIQDVLDDKKLQDIANKSYNANTDGTITGKRALQDIIVLVINSILGLLGVIFLVLIIYAGFLWMTAGGNDDQVGKAKGLLINAIIGVIIIVAAYAISYFVLNALINPT